MEGAEVASQSQTHTENLPFKETPKFKLLTEIESYFDDRKKMSLPQNEYNIFSVISPQDEDRKKWSEILSQVLASEQKNPEKLGLSLKESRGIATLLSLAICDALGASTQFIPFDKKRRDLIANDFEDVRRQVKDGVLHTRSGETTIWTDDCSMALCMADSLLLNNHNMDPKHMRFMFHLWLNHGLNNGGRRYSIGLGGNISISMCEFQKNRKQYTAQGDRFNNGNGSIMRLAPIPLNSLQNEQQAVQNASKSSLTTHNGRQAQLCAKLLSLILVRLINRQDRQWKDTIDLACQHFASSLPQEQTVKYLSLSQQQPETLYKSQIKQHGYKFKKFNKTPQDRNWAWKQEDWTYSHTRAQDQPGYVGSYCMDALAMALHTVWWGHDYQDIVLTNANMGGDCDTVGAIAGQIAGAIYGINPYMLHLYSQMQDTTSGRFDVFLKAYKLVNRKGL